MDKLVRPLPHTPPNRKALLFLFVICGVISFIIWFSTQKKDINKDNFAWMKPFRISYLVNQVNRDTNRGTQEVLEKIRQRLSLNTGLYGIVVYRLEDRVWYGINEDVEFKGASILKVPIMSVAIKEGLETMYGEYSGKQLVFAMGKYSDNEATATLAESLGKEKIQSEIADMGMDNTLFTENTTTPLDVVEMWKNIYKKPETWEFFQDSIFEDRIAPSLTPNHQLIHKVGTDEGVWADSGIIKCQMTNVKPARNASHSDAGGCQIQPYILVILNKDIKRDEAEKTVPEIAEIIANYEVESARQKLPPPASPTPQSK